MTLHYSFDPMAFSYYFQYREARFNVTGSVKKHETEAVIRKNGGDS